MRINGPEGLMGTHCVSWENLHTCVCEREMSVCVCERGKKNKVDEKRGSCFWAEGCLFGFGFHFFSLGRSELTEGSGASLDS